ncbi:sensor histidine kinase [Halorubrum miltondacostae]|uniref:histidine kinase n=1 Tax=Halorubrum miltondacostae TaxID=3076378 RepID=A0ABD5M5C8_9EURY
MLTLRESTNNELNEAVSLERLAKRSWETVETPEAKLVTDGDDVLTGDPSRLQQLFENLYRNTIDHSSGQVTVTVGELADGFYVEDTGPGIPENEREKIFKPGYSTDADNTGLGLAIVQNVAQTHGFEVVVTQANSGGVRFEFKNT